ncbi:MAG: KamA family radical SAM protein [Desulfosudaceae bacterium]
MKTPAEEWQALLRHSITALDNLPARLAPTDRRGAEAVQQIYPMRINAYYAGLIGRADDALGRQVIPDPRELEDIVYEDDPLAETEQSPVPGIIHRYPDRVIFLCSAKCPVLCRFCMRKRLAGRAAPLTPPQTEAALAYIRRHETVREVILSGGDPLLLADEALAGLLREISALAHVDQIRIHTRTPCALPARITPALAALLRRHHPLYINIHVNHPDEVTGAMAAACARLADAGLPLGSQTVLLRGVNDRAATMESLWRRLLRIRVRPYYLHHPDLARGTAHFRVPGGGGKVPLEPGYIVGREKGMLRVTNYQGKTCWYPAGA